VEGHPGILRAHGRVRIGFLGYSGNQIFLLFWSISLSRISAGLPSRLHFPRYSDHICSDRDFSLKDLKELVDWNMDAGLGYRGPLVMLAR
jgi:hypothetical protein